MKRVRFGSAMRRWIGQRLDDLHLLDDRARPAMRDDDRQRMLVLGANMDEMDVQPVNLGDEIRQGVYLRLAFAPVMFRRPILRELLHRRELHALCVVRNLFAVRPFGCLHALAQIGKLGIGEIHMKGANGGFICHSILLAGWIASGEIHGKKTDSACTGRGGKHGAPVGTIGWFGHDGSLRNTWRGSMRIRSDKTNMSAMIQMKRTLARRNSRDTALRTSQMVLPNTPLPTRV